MFIRALSIEFVVIKGCILRVHTMSVSLFDILSITYSLAWWRQHISPKGFDFPFLMEVIDRTIVSLLEAIGSLLYVFIWCNNVSWCCSSEANYCWLMIYYYVSSLVYSIIMMLLLLPNVIGLKRSIRMMWSLMHEVSFPDFNCYCSATVFGFNIASLIHTILSGRFLCFFQLCQ